MEKSLDSRSIRRAVLKNGGDIRATARELATAHTTVLYHLKRANEQSPLVYQSGDPRDREAMTAYVRECLRRAHITLP